MIRAGGQNEQLLTVRRLHAGGVQRPFAERLHILLERLLRQFARAAVQRPVRIAVRAEPHDRKQPIRSCALGQQQRERVMRLSERCIRVPPERGEHRAVAHIMAVDEQAVRRGERRAARIEKRRAARGIISTEIAVYIGFHVVRREHDGVIHLSARHAQPCRKVGVLLPEKVRESCRRRCRLLPAVRCFRCLRGLLRLYLLPQLADDGIRMVQLIRTPSGHAEHHEHREEKPVFDCPNHIFHSLTRNG